MVVTLLVVLPAILLNIFLLPAVAKVISSLVAARSEKSGELFVLYDLPSLWASVWPWVMEMNEASRLTRPVSLEQCKMPVTNGAGSVAPRSLLTADNRGQQVRDGLGTLASARSKDGARFDEGGQFSNRRG